MKKNKYLILILSLLFSISVFSQDLSNFTRDNAYEITKNIKNKLPIKVDKNTLLYDISINENYLFLNYKLVNWIYSELSKDNIERAKKPIQDFIKPSFCNNPIFLFYMKNDYDLMISYSTSDKVKVFNFEIKSEDCER